MHGPRQNWATMGRRITTAKIAATGALLAAFAAPSALAGGLDRELDTDGFDPAAESYRINEARRMNEINRQLELKYRMLWAHGFDPASPPVDQPLGHAYEQTGPNRWEYRPIYPENVQPSPGHGEEIETLPAPDATIDDAQQPGQPPLLIAPQAPAVAPQAPAPRDAIPADQLIPQSKPRKAKPRGPREF